MTTRSQLGQMWQAANDALFQLADAVAETDCSPTFTTQVVEMVYAGGPLAQAIRAALGLETLTGAEAQSEACDTVVFQIEQWLVSDTVLERLTEADFVALGEDPAVFGRTLQQVADRLQWVIDKAKDFAGVLGFTLEMNEQAGFEGIITDTVEQTARDAAPIAAGAGVFALALVVLWAMK